MPNLVDRLINRYKASLINGSISDKDFKILLLPNTFRYKGSLSSRPCLDEFMKAIGPLLTEDTLSQLITRALALQPKYSHDSLQVYLLACEAAFYPHHAHDRLTSGDYKPGFSNHMRDVLSHFPVNLLKFIQTEKEYINALQALKVCPLPSDKPIREKIKQLIAEIQKEYTNRSSVIFLIKALKNTTAFLTGKMTLQQYNAAADNANTPGSPLIAPGVGIICGIMLALATAVAITLGVLCVIGGGPMGGLGIALISLGATTALTSIGLFCASTRNRVSKEMIKTAHAMGDFELSQPQSRLSNK